MAGTQNVETRVAGCGDTEDVMATPGDTPVSVIERHVESPKHPGTVCPGQKRPDGLDVPASIGSRLLRILTDWARNDYRRRIRRTVLS